MNQPSFPEPNQDITLQDTTNSGQIGQAGRDLTQIQARNVTFNQTQIIQIAIAEIKTRPLLTASPYRGLQSFDLQDKDYFFGRDQFLTGLVNELESASFILLLGASGSGKSSVVRAGLIPWLAQQYAAKFIAPIFTPDRDPFESFYASLLQQHYKQSDVSLLRRGRAESLVQTVQTLKQSNSYWFIFIDQFEELFTTSQSDQRTEFLEGIVRLNKLNDRSLKIMMTMRADFLDRLSPYPELIKLTDKHRPLLAEMQRDELRLAIEQPAAQHGVVFEEGLVEEIIKDVQGQAGYLPLLQYTLNLLWETETQIDQLRDRTLNISTYRRLGGIRGALQRHVDHIYVALSPQEQSATQRIFLKLVGIGGDEESETEWKPIRRRAARTEFNDELEQRVLTQLIDQKLLVSDRQPSTQQSTVELAHEVLLTSWTTFNCWIHDNREAIALRNRLNDDVARWQAKKVEDELWSGSKLEQVLELRRNVTFNQILGGFSELAQQFIDASRQKRDRQKRRFLMTVTAACLFIASTGVGFGVLQQREKRNVEDAFLNADAPTASLIARLPVFLSSADRRRKEVDRVQRHSNSTQALAYYQHHQAAIDQALIYYRKILTATIRLQAKLQADPNALPLSSQEQQTIQRIRAQAEQSLAELLNTYRIPQLQLALENHPNYSSSLSANSGDLTPADRALIRQILMHNAGADTNGSDELETLEEAEQIPCETLESIEKLWQQLIDKRCGWYVSETESGEWEAPGCSYPQEITLSYALFDSVGYQHITDRLKRCRASEL